MKRRLTLLFVLAMVSIGMMAQTSLIAVLSHDGQISSFTGNTALSEAYKAATAGDVITLSPGQFDAITVEKPITIRGGGMYGDNATIINGRMTISGNVEGSITFEGLAFNSTLYQNRQVGDINVMKCFITEYSVNLYPCPVKFTHCELSLGSNSQNAIFIGCSIAVRVSELKNCVVNNSIIMSDRSYSSIWGTGNQYTNCIFDFSGGNYSSAVSKNNTFMGCVYIGDATNPMQSNVPSGAVSNKVFPNGTQYLKEGTTTFELLDELQTTWLGTDGTQVGMHGGSFPFDPITTNPQITKFDVSSKTSADGKLSVDIQVDMK